jgi:hypothetical protein
MPQMVRRHEQPSSAWIRNPARSAGSWSSRTSDGEFAGPRGPAKVASPTREATGQAWRAPGPLVEAVEAPTPPPEVGAPCRSAVAAKRQDLGVSVEEMAELRKDSVPAERAGAAAELGDLCAFPVPRPRRLHHRPKPPFGWWPVPLAWRSALPRIEHRHLRQAGSPRERGWPARCPRPAPLPPWMRRAPRPWLPTAPIALTF